MQKHKTKKQDKYNRINRTNIKRQSKTQNIEKIIIQTLSLNTKRRAKRHKTKNITNETNKQTHKQTNKQNKRTNKQTKQNKKRQQTI